MTGIGSIRGWAAELYPPSSHHDVSELPVISRPNQQATFSLICGVAIYGLAYQKGVTAVKVPQEFESPVSYGKLDYVCLLEPVTRDELLSEQQLREIITLGREYQPERAKVGNVSYSDHRKVIRRHMELNERTQQFHDQMYALVQEMNKKYFGFEITGMLPPDYMLYGPEFGHFGWHSDFVYQSLSVVRKLSLVIQLSDEKEYEGGELQVFLERPKAQPKERGSVIAFPAFLQHQVTPVTRGVRQSLVIFSTGPMFR